MSSPTRQLVGIERHQLVSLGTFDAVVLPLEGDAVVVERDQAPVGDGDAVGVAREIAQHFLGATERLFAVDDPFAVAQRSQIGGKGSCPKCLRSAAMAIMVSAEALNRMS